MKTVLAYIIVIVISQFCLTAGAFVGAILSLILFWLPDRIRAPLCSFVGGTAGSVLAVTIAFFVFKWLVGPDSFGWGPLLAATVPLAIPIYKDYRKSLELKLIESEFPESVAKSMTPTTSSFKNMVFGELTGIILGGVLFL